MPITSPAAPPDWPAGEVWMRLIMIGSLDIWLVELSLKWSGRLDSNQRPPHPQCDALPGCATPRLAGASRQGHHSRKGAAGGQVVRRRRKMKAGRLVGRAFSAALALPALYLTAALIGSLVPVNRGW